MKLFQFRVEDQVGSYGQAECALRALLTDMAAFEA